MYILFGLRVCLYIVVKLDAYVIGFFIQIFRYIKHTMESFAKKNSSKMLFYIFRSIMILLKNNIEVLKNKLIEKYMEKLLLNFR